MKLHALLLAVCATAVAALAATPARAAILTVPLPSLAGDYSLGPSGTVYTAALHFPAPPVTVRGAWLRVRGTSRSGTLECHPFLDTSPISLAFDAEIHETPAYWAADGPTSTADGAFDWTVPFELWAFGGSTPFGFLDDGTAEIHMGVYVGMLVECHIVEPGPSATVDEATFLLDADFPTSAAPTSWGKVKAIYR